MRIPLPRLTVVAAQIAAAVPLLGPGPSAAAAPALGSGPSAPAPALSSSLAAFVLMGPITTFLHRGWSHHDIREERHA